VDIVQANLARDRRTQRAFGDLVRRDAVAVGLDQKSADGSSSADLSRAQTMATSAIGEFVIHVFEPFST